MRSCAPERNRGGSDVELFGLWCGGQSERTDLRVLWRSPHRRSMGADEVALVQELETLKPALLATAYVPTTLEGQQAAFDQAMRRTSIGVFSILWKSKRRSNGQLLDRADLLVDIMQANPDPEAAATAQRAGAALAASRSAQKKQTMVLVAVGAAFFGAASCSW